MNANCPNLMVDFADEETDIPSILNLCQQFWQHTQFDEPFDGEQCMKMLQQSLDQDFTFVLIDQDNDSVVGMIIGLITPLLASTAATQVVEMAFYIDPKYRRSGGGSMLIDAFEQRAIESQCRYAHLAYMHTSMPEIVKQIYIDRGYKQAESYYTKKFGGFQ